MFPTMSMSMTMTMKTMQRTEKRMSDAYIKNVVEAALLAAARPVSVAELQQIFDEHSRPTTKEMRAILEALGADYEGRGVTIRETATGFRFQVRTEFAHEVSRLWPDRPRKYSRALLETIALIAYRQPITRAEIENVRGVAVNPEIVKTLMERNWVRVVGHRDVPGHPELLGTTTEFLDYFSLKSIEDLPPLADIKSLTDLNLQLPLPVSTEGTPESGDTLVAEHVDSGEVAVVPVVDDGAETADATSESDDRGGLEASSDDDGDDDELSAPGNSAAGLVAAPPSDEN
jgi:segregation and condensation protein B